MCMTNEAAAIKLAERDNLVGELVEACKSAADYMCGPTAWTLAEADALIDRLHAVIAKAREGAKS